MDSFVQEVFELIIKNQGIDTPAACIQVNKGLNRPGHLEGFVLAKWLSKHHTQAWDKTCSAVDALVETGQVHFNDDGELRATGY